MDARVSAAAMLILLTGSVASAQSSLAESQANESGGAALGRSSSAIDGRFTSGVRTRLTASDNIDLEDDGEETGTLLEIGPYITYAVNRPRLQTNLAYALRYYDTSGELGSDGVRHDLNGRIKAALWQDTFWINGLATVAEATRDPIGQGTVDPGRQEGGRTTIQRYAVAPYFSDYLSDRNTSYVIGYGASFAKDSSLNEGQITQRLIGNVSRDPNRRGLGWAFESEQSNSAFESSEEDYDTSRLTAEALVRPSAKLRFGVGLQYDRVTAIQGDNRENSGWSPTVSTLWTPNQRTEFSARYAKPYYGSTSMASFAYQPSRWTFGAQYNYGLTDIFSGPLASADVQSSLSTGSGSRPASESSVVNQLLAEGVLPAFGTTVTSGFVAGAISRTRRLMVNAGWAGKRTSFGVSAARLRSESQVTTINLPTTAGAPAGLRQSTVSVSASRRLDRRSSARINVQSTISAATDDSAKSQLNTLTLSWTRQIAKKLSMLASYRLAHQQNRIGQTRSYREQAIAMGVNYRF